MTTINPETLAQIETEAEAQAAFDLLDQMARAVNESPGGRGLYRERVSPLTGEELRDLARAQGLELAIITHELGALLRGELDAAGLRILARKAVFLVGDWKGTAAKVERMKDKELGELLQTIGKQCAVAVSACVRSPEPPSSFEELRRGDGY